VQVRLVVPTVAEYAEIWKARQLWRPTTMVQVDCYLRRHILPSFGAQVLDEVTAADVQSWVRSLNNSLAPASVRVITAHLRSLFNEAVRDGKVSASPVRHVRLPRDDRQPTRPPTVEQVRALLGALPVAHQSIGMVLTGTGMRQGEVLGLTVDRVDFVNRLVHVDRQLARDRSAGLFGPPKTRASMRTIPVTESLLAKVEGHIGFHGLGVADLLFHHNGQPLARRRVSSIWAPAAHAASLPPNTGMHCLRHFYASLLIRAGCSVKVVQARLGHATASETLDTYAHLWSDDDEQTRESLARIERHLW
jgi:integrase